LDDDVLPSNDQSACADELQSNFERVIVTNVDGNASANKLCAVAVYHIKNKSGGYIQGSYDPEPVNEFLIQIYFQ
jgi:hypothetical protein